MYINEFKSRQLELVAEHRTVLRKKPHLRWLFFEIINKCNLRCSHCGSSCLSDGQQLSVDDIRRTLITINDDKPMVCVTGGEPLLHPDFFGIIDQINKMGFKWGMTTNGTLIDEKKAEDLARAQIATVSVSLDGMEESHDKLRGYKGAWELAVRGLSSLIKAGIEPQVTTVCHRGNIEDIEELYELINSMGITSWRVINVEPIGRACESDGMMLDEKQFRWLLSFIRSKRFDNTCDMEVTYGCSHYLGLENERMVREHYFLCGAGLLTASVRSNGDICACLDIENRSELVQGNIKNDNFLNVWINKFKEFRYDRTEYSSKCRDCTERLYCGGDSYHTWDYEKMEPKLCYKDFMFGGSENHISV